MSDNKKNKDHEYTFHLKAPPGKVNKDSTWMVPVNITYDPSCPLSISQSLPTSYQLTVTNKKMYFIGVSYNGVYSALAKPDKPTEGTGEFSMG